MNEDQNIWPILNSLDYAALKGLLEANGYGVESGESEEDLRTAVYNDYYSGGIDFQQLEEALNETPEYWEFC